MLQWYLLVVCLFAHPRFEIAAESAQRQLVDVSCDRRMRKLLNVTPGVRIYVPDWRPRHKCKLPPRYVFSVTTGHSGSTSMSSAASYEGTRVNEIAFRHEEQFGVARSWREWWDRGPNTLEQAYVVQTQYKYVVDGVLSSEHKRTFVDLGHHNLHGISTMIPPLFGDQALLVRLRRSRYHTAFSFETHRRDLCDNDFRICPLKHRVQLHPNGGPWTEDIWRELDYTQQAFWYIDEVEAHWQWLRLSYPDMAYLECDWKDDLAPCVRALAAALGVDAAGGVGAKLKQHRRSNESATCVLQELIEKDSQYKAMMNYQPDVADIIKKAQF